MVPAARVTEGPAPAAVAAEAGAAVAAPATVAAIHVVAAEDLPATRPATAALVPVLKPQCFFLLLMYSLLFLPPNFSRCQLLIFIFAFLVMVSLLMILVCTCTLPESPSLLTFPFPLLLLLLFSSPLPCFMSSQILNITSCAVLNFKNVEL